MRKEIGILSLCFAASSLLAAPSPSKTPPTAPASPPSQSVQPQAKQPQTKQPQNGSPQTMQKGCASLSVEEQAFASTLSAANKGLFCNQFNTAQRAAAMNAQGLKDAAGNPVSADDAVIQVAKDNNMAPHKAPGSSGGCPSRK
jgi:hypothetical protein